MTPLWLTRASFPVLHPRQALCDAGIWKCSTHPRMLWLPSERRWAWRHKLRARRVARWSGWQPGELAALMAPRLDPARAALNERLAGDLRLLWGKRQRAVTMALLDEVRANGVILAPWQEELIRRHLEISSRTLGIVP
ncbi:hypothetical protein I5G62_gp92 [Mycobacterium phage CRB2]|uniref:Uncharacterized protein n=1 Tax=Mycobacterium phage CRB2 TaxID=2483623 RepID=A0A455LYC7_9CAUD|nr:hypothetical protein I5G62_gp92 [Mycobacterium phage CRB2]AYP70078.1 hypothetical protein CRB2_92 [Mycobacterium phage CRB2]